MDIKSPIISQNVSFTSNLFYHHDHGNVISLRENKKEGIVGCNSVEQDEYPLMQRQEGRVTD
jgi:hypothetical protein